MGLAYTPKINEFVSAYDYLGRPTGKEEGLKLYKKAVELGLTIKEKDIEIKTYKGKIKMYPLLFLEIYFRRYTSVLLIVIKLKLNMERITDYSKKIQVIEIYPCVQSEGSRQGRPTVAIRTTGCTHRCWFGEAGWCDSWYTSIHPEKAKFTFNDIIKVYDENPHIKEMMLTGGAPTMHPSLVNELTHFAHERGIFITMETEGSHFVETDYPIGLISLSPKFSNSVPKVGILTPMGKEVDQKFVDQHNKYRLNNSEIKR